MTMARICEVCIRLSCTALAFRSLPIAGRATPTADNKKGTVNWTNETMIKVTLGEVCVTDPLAVAVIFFFHGV